MTAGKELVLSPQTPLQEWQPFISKVLPLHFGEHFGTVMSDAINIAEGMGLQPKSFATDGLLAMEAAGLIRVTERDDDYIIHRIQE